MTIFKYVFKRTLQGKLDILMLLVLPIISVFISTETWISIPLGFQLYGILLLILASKLCKTLMEDREKKVVLRISAAPITHLRYLGENLLAYTVILTAINGLVVALGVIRYGAEVIQPLEMFLLFTAFSSAAIGLSIAWYALFQSLETAYSILGGLYIALAMLGGMFWPIEIMPETVQRVAQILPTYWFAHGMRQIAFEGFNKDFIFTLGLLFLFSIAFTLLGSRRRLG